MENCDKTFDNCPDFVRHQDVHEPTEKLACPYYPGCSRNVGPHRRQVLLDHCAKDHNLYLDRQWQFDRVDPSIQKVWACRICPQSSCFPTSKELAKHEWKHSSKEGKTRENGHPIMYVLNLLKHPTVHHHWQYLAEQRRFKRSEDFDMQELYNLITQLEWIGKIRVPGHDLTKRAQNLLQVPEMCPTVTRSFNPENQTGLLPIYHGVDCEQSTQQNNRNLEETFYGVPNSSLPSNHLPPSVATEPVTSVNSEYPMVPVNPVRPTYPSGPAAANALHSVMFVPPRRSLVYPTLPTAINSPSSQNYQPSTGTPAPLIHQAYPAATHAPVGHTLTPDIGFSAYVVYPNYPFANGASNRNNLGSPMGTQANSVNSLYPSVASTLSGRTFPVSTENGAQSVYSDRSTPTSILSGHIPTSGTGIPVQPFYSEVPSASLAANGYSFPTSMGTSASTVASTGTVSPNHSFSSDHQSPFVPPNGYPFPPNMETPGRSVYEPRATMPRTTNDYPYPNVGIPSRSNYTSSTLTTYLGPSDSRIQF